MRRVAWVLLLGLWASGCSDKEGGKKEPPAPEPVPATIDASVAPTPVAIDAAPIPREFWLRGDLLEERQGDAPARPLAELEKARFCALDPGADLLWLHDGRGLHVHDLQSKATTTLLRGELTTIDIRFGDEIGRVGNADEDKELVVLALMATESPELRSEVVCDDDARRAECYANTDSDDPMQWELRPEIKALKSRYDGLELLEKPLIAELAKRRQSWHQSHPDHEQISTAEQPSSATDPRVRYCGSLP